MLEQDFADMQEKIMGVCKESKLEFNFEGARFPVVARINPDLSQRDQMRFDIDETDGEVTNFVNGEIKFIFDDELTMTVFNDFKIEDSLLNRIKNMVKKLHYIYLQIYFKKKTI